MAGTKFDVIIGGTSAKIAWDNEGAFRKRFVRREIEQQIISQSNGVVLSSRADQRQLYQSTWSGGAQWWKPLMGDVVDTYFQGNHMNLWAEPGKVVPANQVLETTDTNMEVTRLVTGANLTYMVGITLIEDSTYYDLYVWTPGSDAWVRDPGLTSGFTDRPNSLVYDPGDLFFYGIEDNFLNRFRPSTNTTDAEWISGLFLDGSVIMFHNSLIMVYDGDQIYTVDKAVPDLTSVANDGKGADILQDMVHPSSQIIRQEDIDLAVATPEGIYYVKNVWVGAQPVPYVFRVDLDAAGAWIVNPIATLPAGNIALGITYHLGSIIISTSPDWQGVMKNTAHVEIVLYHVTQGGMGALGSVLGGRDELDETPYRLVRAEGPYLYFTGNKRLWVYDAIRGGIHTAFDFPSAPTNGAWSDMAMVENSSGEIVHLFSRTDRYALQKLDKVDDPDTVVNFGDDTTHYVLESNYFDGALPMELKELSKVAVQHDPIDASGDQQWTVQVSADDAAFVTAVDSNVADSVFIDNILTGTSGYRFRYRFIYQTRTSDRLALRAVYVTFSTGEMIAEWDMLLDGAELLNVDNKVQDEGAFYAALTTIATTEAVTTLIDNVTNQDQNVQDGSTPTDVKVVAVEIVKDKPGESLVRVVLRQN